MAKRRSRRDLRDLMEFTSVAFVFAFPRQISIDDSLFILYNQRIDSQRTRSAYNGALVINPHNSGEAHGRREGTRDRSGAITN